MTPFICPLCKNPLIQKDRSHVCIKNHHFDIAKEGYLNLLPINSKKSKLPGDNKEMMMARRGFLSSGGFLPLAETLTDILSSLYKERKITDILDLGCGEGYYTGHIVNQLTDSFNFSALDISKVAVRYASKRYKNINFCVASAFSIPLEDDSLDGIIRIYAPSLESELKRVIKKGGYLITVTPAPRHLYQLREIIYNEVNDHPEENSAPDGFKKITQTNLHYTLPITERQVLTDLVYMTPFAWKFNKEKMDLLLNMEPWNIECDFNIEIFEKQ